MTHRLDSCMAKLDRAEEGIASLAREIASFESGPAFPFDIKREHRGAEYVFIASGSPVTPLRFAVLAGEIVHHMRASFDHLVHALVLQSGRNPTRNQQFPICTTEASFRKASERGQVNGISSSAMKLIEAYQPFNAEDPYDDVLHVVSSYDNTDKHRLLIVLSAAAAIGETLVFEDEPTAPPANRGRDVSIVGMTPPVPRPVSPAGEVVFSVQFAEPAPHVAMTADIVPAVVFEQCGRAIWVRVAPTLEGMARYVRQVIQSFAGEFD